MVRLTDLSATERESHLKRIDNLPRFTSFLMVVSSG